MVEMSVEIKGRKKFKPPYDEETLAWLEDTTVKNMLLECGGNLNRLTRGQVTNLKRRGIMKSDSYRGRHFTIKGLEMWDALRDETAQI